MRDLIEALYKYGLSPNEAKAYIALVTHGPLNAKKVSLLTNIPFTKIYSVLNSLIKKGWVYKTENLFKPKSPREVTREVKNQMMLELDKYAEIIENNLQTIFEARLTAEQPDLWLIYGEDNIREKLIDMIRYTNKELSIALHIHVKDIIPMLEMLRKRGINIRILTTKSLIKDFKILCKECIRIKEDMFGGGVISDVREAMIIIGSGKDVIAIWSNHIELVSIAKHYFETLWSTAEQLV